LTTIFPAGAKNTDSQHVRKVDLQRAFPLDVLMVPSLVLIVITSCERLSSDVFSLSQTIHFGSLEFIIDRFGGLSLSPMGNGSDATIMGSTCGGLTSSPWAMIGDSIEGFYMTSNEEGRIDLPSPRRHKMGALIAPAATISWPQITPTTQAIVAIPPQQATPWSDTNHTFERRRAH
jgi:hypothetical protein